MRLICKMLMGGSGIAEPRVVGHIHQQRRGLQYFQLIRRVGVFVTNRQRQFLAGGVERILIVDPGL